jgi:dihydroorotase
MAELRDAGCVGYSQADAPMADNQVLAHALEYAATFGFCAWLRPQDPSLARGGVAHDGEVATRLGLPAVPVCAETVALSTILILAHETGARIHLCRLSSAEGVELVRAAKSKGMAVTCDVAANHVHLSEMDIGYFDANCNLVPPLRSLRDRDALMRGLADGTIDAICSDHTPVDEDAKQRPFAEAEPGATGLELLLPLTLKWAAQTGTPLPAALRKVTSGPLGVLCLPGGSLNRGEPADLCLFDPAAWWKVEPSALYSQGKNTPFLGLEVQGKVRYTLVGGQVVFEAESQP